MRQTLESGANASMKLCWPFFKQEGGRNIMARTSEGWNKILQEEFESKGLSTPLSNATMMLYSCPRLKTSLTTEGFKVIFEFDKVWDEVWENKLEVTEKESLERKFKTKYILNEWGNLRPAPWTSSFWSSDFAPTTEEMGQHLLNKILIAKLEAVA